MPIIKYELLLELLKSFYDEYYPVPSTNYDIRMSSRNAPYDVCICIHNTEMVARVYDYRTAICHDPIKVDISDPDLLCKLRSMFDDIRKTFAQL